MRNALLMITLTLGFGLAHAETPVAANAAAEADNASNTATLTKADQRAEHNCLRHTGTRLADRNKRGCLANAPGRAYNRADIDNTAEIDMGKSVRHLDPSMTRSIAF